MTKPSAGAVDHRRYQRHMAIRRALLLTFPELDAALGWRIVDWITLSLLDAQDRARDAAPAAVEGALERLRTHGRYAEMACTAEPMKDYRADLALVVQHCASMADLVAGERARCAALLTTDPRCPTLATCAKDHAHIGHCYAAVLRALPEAPRP